LVSPLHKGQFVQTRTKPPVAAIDAAALETVTGGASSNIDASTFRWQAVGEDAAVPVSTSFKARTNYGACVDQGVQACDTAGGGNAAIGACKLNVADACWTKTKQ
jgi:hypothetical protein